MTDHGTTARDATTTRSGRVEGVVAGGSVAAVLLAAAPPVLWTVAAGLAEALPSTLGDTPIPFVLAVASVVAVVGVPSTVVARRVTRAVRAGRSLGRVLTGALLLAAAVVWVPLGSFWTSRVGDARDWREDAAACDEALLELVADADLVRHAGDHGGTTSIDTAGDPGVVTIMETVRVDGVLRGVACEVRTDTEGPGPVERIWLREPWGPEGRS